MFEAWVLCLAMVIHFEAATEPIDGQFMVAMSVWNRAQGDKNRLCEEAYKPHAYSGLTKRPPIPPEDNKAFKHAVKIAQLSAHMKDFTGGVDHYHTLQVSPNWAYGRDKRLEMAGVYGNHVTYRPKSKK